VKSNKVATFSVPRCNISRLCWSKQNNGGSAQRARNTMNHLIHRLTPFDRPRLVRHFVALDPEDRWLRFGNARPDEMLAAYVAQIDFGRDLLFGIFGDSFELAAVAHVGRLGNTAELGLSVLRPWRRSGLAKGLAERAIRSAVNRGCTRLWIHFVAENSAMAAFTAKLGMTVTASRGEADAWLELPNASPFALGIDLYETQVEFMFGAFRHYLPPLVPRAA